MRGPRTLSGGGSRGGPSSRRHVSRPVPKRSCPGSVVSEASTLSINLWRDTPNRPGWVVSDSPRQVEQLLGGRPSDRELPVGGASMRALWVATRRGRTAGEVVESRQSACHCGRSGTRCTSENTKSAAAPVPAHDLSGCARSSAGSSVDCPGAVHHRGAIIVVHPSFCRPCR